MTTGEQIKRVAYSPNEAARALGLSLNHVYDLIRLGRIPSVRMGKRILIPKAEIDRLMQSANNDTTEG